MSRCFPFPPPGYEKKARSDDVDLITKEKHREKKQKKEKKDKEKREGKEKKDKDKSKDKHREKKDRKEKHKDKKKDKDRDKDKSKASDEKRTEGKSEGNNDAKLAESSQRAEELRNSKFTEELGRRIRDEARGTGSQMVENIAAPDQRRMEGISRAMEKDIEKRGEAKDKNKNKEGDDRRREGQEERDERRGVANQIFQNITGLDQRRVEGTVRPAEKERDERRGVGSQIFQTFTGLDQRRVEGMVRPSEREESDERRAVGNQIFQNITGLEQRRVEGMVRPAEREERDERRGVGNHIFQNITGFDQRRVEGMVKSAEKDARPTEKDTEKNIEKKEKRKEGSDKKGDRKKDKNREEKKRSKGKDKDRNKEKEKEKEKLKDHGEHKQKQDKIQESGKEQIATTLNIKPSYIPTKDSERTAGPEGNLKKRKDFETNGFIHENDMRPNKLVRPVSSSHLPLENGRKVEPCHIAIPRVPGKQGMTVDIRKVEINKEQQQPPPQQPQQSQQLHHKANGIMGSQPPAVTLRPSVSIEGSENGEASTRPPHPDSKYLSQILAVPKMAEWSDFDEQEWLFNGDNSKPKVAASNALSETPQAWAEAVRIESADVYALPYVIPY